jgi:hypothetical protein
MLTFGHTHFSPAKFKKAKRPILGLAKASSFPCLWLGWGFGFKVSPSQPDISQIWVAQETKNVQQTSLKMNFLQNMYHSEQQPEIHQFSLAFPIFSALSPFHLVSAQSGRTTSLGQH